MEMVIFLFVSLLLINAEKRYGDILITALIRAMLGAAVFGVVASLVPGVPRSDPDGKIDWVGAYLGVAGLVLFNFVWK
jgi:hypothetical protein